MLSQYENRERTAERMSNRKGGGNAPFLFDFIPYERKNPKDDK